MSNIKEYLDIPEEYISKIPKITILGFNEILIENFKSILEYENFFVRINTYIGNVNISGFDLSLTQMNEEDILIKGKISSLEFEKKGVKDDN